jgi:hypothetical protein
MTVNNAFRKVSGAMLKPNSWAKEGNGFLNEKGSTASDADADKTPTIEQQIRQGSGNSEYHQPAVSCLI